MTLPPWLDRLYSAEEMRAADAWAISEAGVPSLDLMERAGEGLARVIARAAAPGPVRIVLGAGNNAGDGLVAGRVLRAKGVDVDLLAAGPLERLRGDARVNLDRLPGPPPRPFIASELAGSGVVVDALLGTGSAGAPRAPLDEAIEAINAQQAPVVACDVPSGVDASTGEVAGIAVRARVTATFHGPKTGLFVLPGAICAGEVHVVDIGMPRGAPLPEAAGLLSERTLAELPRRGRESSKFTSGTVVICGGSRGLTGAPSMAALAAMRAGAGYVQVAAPGSAQPALELRLLEAMTRGLPETDGTHGPDGVEALLELAERARAVVLGPGLGRTPAAQAFAREVARNLPVPLVLDADGLNAHEGALETLAQREAPTILTPHAGELGRLLGRPSAEVDASRLASAREAAERTRALVVLKGSDTLVAGLDGPVAISSGAPPALATAGTGDVLAGVLGALLARGAEPLLACASAVVAHSRAGELAAERHGSDHVIAGDVIDALAPAMAR